MGADSFFSMFTIDFFYSTIRMAAPIALAAMGEVYLEKAGIINLGLEAMMLFGAFFGFLGSSLMGDPFLGILVAVLSGALFGLLFGFISITLRSNQIVAGAAFNILAFGLTSFLARIIFGIRQLPVKVTGFEPLPIPLLSKIPFIGPVLFSQTFPVYVVYIMVILMTFVLYRTTWGLKIRSVGENPRAADTVGVDVNSWRFGCTILNGALAGFAGAMLSLAHLTTFIDNMTAGRGYIALAAVTFGRWNPLGASFASVLFGALDALQMRLQAFGVNIPSDFLLASPYVVTFLAVIIFRGKAASPSNLAEPYEKEASR